MKATVIEKESPMKNWEIKVGRKKYATVWFPNEFHPKTFVIEFYNPNLALTDIPDVHTAQGKVEKICRDFYGITEIVNKAGYPLKLLAVFEDELLKNVAV